MLCSDGVFASGSPRNCCTPDTQAGGRRGQGAEGPPPASPCVQNTASCSVGLGKRPVVHGAWKLGEMGQSEEGRREGNRYPGRLPKCLVLERAFCLPGPRGSSCQRFPHERTGVLRGF